MWARLSTSVRLQFSTTSRGSSPGQSRSSGGPTAFTLAFVRFPPSLARVGKGKSGDVRRRGAACRGWRIGLVGRAGHHRRDYPRVGAARRRGDGGGDRRDYPTGPVPLV